MGIVLIINLMKMNHSAVVAFLHWMRRGFASPAPQFVKWMVLENWGGKQTWIETGTYKGETTSRLARFSKMVYSIEASPYFAEAASRKFNFQDNVKILTGLSEVRLPELLKSLTAEEKTDISFWLDGHFSGESTFQGPSDTPIRQELAAIEEHFSDYSIFSLLVDDVRCFNPLIPEFANYPHVEFLVEWANSHKLFWTIEHDIFIATNRQRSV